MTSRLGIFFFFSSRRRHTRFDCDWSSDVCSSDLQLWADGATKRRWLFLPDGAQIDSADPDHWRFPAGTRLWKEFTRDGVRVETRIMHKTGDGDADRKSTRLNSSHSQISYAVFCLK